MEHGLTIKPLAWDLCTRFRLIEIFLQWEGRLTSTQLQNMLHIGRPQATKLIKSYDQYRPAQMAYNKRKKCYQPTSQFQPQFTQGIADEYLQMLTMQQQLADSPCITHIQNNTTPHHLIINAAPRHVNAHLLRQVIQACQEQQRLEIEYASIKNPEPETRVIQPHNLIFNGYRWHTRAWCEKKKEYRDFVLTRCYGTTEILTEATHTAQGDKTWQTHATLKIIADPRLTTAQQKLVAEDYGFINNQLIIATRAALVTYYLQLLRLSPYEPQRDPEKQQIVVGNWEDVEEWVW